MHPPRRHRSRAARSSPGSSRLPSAPTGAASVTLVRAPVAWPAICIDSRERPGERPASPAGCAPLSSQPRHEELGSASDDPPDTVDALAGDIAGLLVLDPGIKRSAI